MAIENAEWESILTAIRREVQKSTNFFIQAVVLKSDNLRKVVWVKEFGDTPVPVVGFNYTVNVYDNTGSGTVLNKYTTEPDAPEIGDLVLIALVKGSRRLPRCLGIVRAIDLIEQGELN